MNLNYHQVPFPSGAADTGRQTDWYGLHKTLSASSLPLMEPTDFSASEHKVQRERGLQWLLIFHVLTGRWKESRGVLDNGMLAINQKQWG